MTGPSAKLIRLDAADNVLVALGSVGPGAVTLADGQSLVLATQVTLGHKIACRPIGKGETVVKYGMPIGIASRDIGTGDHVHVHNVQSQYTATHYRQDDAGLSDG